MDVSDLDFIGTAMEGNYAGFKGVSIRYYPTNENIRIYDPMSSVVFRNRKSIKRITEEKARKLVSQIVMEMKLIK